MAKFNTKGGSGGKGKSNQKKKKIGLADKVTKKSTSATKTSVNPFEVKVNKQKFNIIGRTNAATKHERGRPGVARARANKKREETLLPEFRDRFKENKFVDMRIGEKNSKLSAEDKMAMRFAAERLKSHSKKSKFNLGEDEVLTHHGQSLIDIEKFEDPRSDSEDESNPKLDRSFVSDAHFGGFLSKADNSEDSLKKRESLIDQLIADSKRRKEERQKEREETTDLTEELDMEYQTVLQLLNSIKKSGKDKDAPVTSSTVDAEGKPSNDPNAAYDLLVREMRFEVRGTPTDKMKSADEVARLEKERLERLEAERLQRMRGEIGDSTSKKTPHRSADALDDGFDYGDDATDVQPVSYDKDSAKMLGDKTATEETEEADEDVEEEGEGEEEDDAEEEEDGDEESEDDDDFSDLASDEEHEDDEVLKKQKSEKKIPLPKKEKLEKNSDLPFVFKVPATYEEFHDLMSSYGEDQRPVVLERMIKCTHPSLDSSNRSKLEQLYAFLLQFVNDFSEQGLENLSALAPPIFNLVQLISASSAASMLLDVILEKRDEFLRQNKKRPVPMSTIIFLKLVELIFPASDFRHNVTTPALQFITEALLCPVLNYAAIATGLALCSLAYEYTALSKRYIPEVSYFLNGLLVLATARGPSKAAEITTPFRPVGAESQLLVIENPKESRSLVPRKLALSDLTDGQASDELRISLVSTAVDLIKDFCGLWSELPSAKEIWAPVSSSLAKIDWSVYPESVENAVKTVSGKIREILDSERTKLVHESKKPKPLKLFEPAFEEHFDGRKKRVGSKEKLEQQKLQHKLKREMKGAIREIRRDNAFLARQQLKEQLQKDAERKRKVNHLLSSLATQESDVRKMKKQKRK